MNPMILGLLFIICIFLPSLFNFLEGIDNAAYDAIRIETDMLPKYKEESYLLNHGYDDPQNNDPDKGQNVKLFMSYAKPTDIQGRNLFNDSKNLESVK